MAGKINTVSRIKKPQKPRKAKRQKRHPPDFVNGPGSVIIAHGARADDRADRLQGMRRFSGMKGHVSGQRVSAGILVYRWKDGALEVLIAHPGGPFFASKDEGHWTI